jgi:hypothetical protein
LSVYYFNMRLCYVYTSSSGILHSFVRTVKFPPYPRRSLIVGKEAPLQVMKNSLVMVKVTTALHS